MTSRFVYERKLDDLIGQLAVALFDIKIIAGQTRNNRRRQWLHETAGTIDAAVRYLEELRLQSHAAA
jgi:hypothetical protein